MAYRSRKFNSGKNIRWKWPLVISDGRANAPLLNQFFNSKLSKFSQKFKLIKKDAGARKPNILVINAERKITRVVGLRSIQADVVIVCTYSGNDYEPAIDKAPELAKEFKASAVIVMPAAVIRMWFDHIIFALLQGKDILEVVDNTKLYPFILYDPSVVRGSRMKPRIQDILRLAHKNDHKISAKYLKVLETQLKGFEYRVEDVSPDKVGNKTIAYLNDDLHKALTVITGQLLRRMPAKKGDDHGKTIPASDKQTTPKSPSSNWLDELEFTNIEYTDQVGDGVPDPATDSGSSGDSPSRGGDRPKGRKPPSQKIVEKTDPVEPNRRLFTGILNDANKLQSKALAPSQKYILKVFIGKEMRGFVSSGVNVNYSDLFYDNKAGYETIQVHLSTNLSKKLVARDIRLPRVGNSTTAEFPFRTNAKIKKFIAQVLVYHKNRLLQHEEVTIDVTAEPGNKRTLYSKTVVFTGQDLEEAQARTLFAASLSFSDLKKDDSEIQGIADDQPVKLDFPPALNGKLGLMKTYIQDSLIEMPKKPLKLTAQANQNLLRKLAIQGYLIYGKIKEVGIKEGPIQIIAKKEDHALLDYIYTLPAPTFKATLCKHATKALEEGKCQGCPDYTKKPSDHICPFGFWAFSRIIERHGPKKKIQSDTDYLVTHKAFSKRDALALLQHAIYGSSIRVDKEIKGTRKLIGKAIEDSVKKYFQADEWKLWSETVNKHHPQSLILVVHAETNEEFDVQQIELGDKDFKEQTQFKTDVLAMKDDIPPPFVMILGCETSNLQLTGFDIAATLMDEGAAIVISNFTQVSGLQAKDIVINLLKLIKEKAAKETTFGEIILRLRQLLLAQGMIGALSLITKGDADWKITS